MEGSQGAQPYYGLPRAWNQAAAHQLSLLLVSDLIRGQLGGLEGRVSLRSDSGAPTVTGSRAWPAPHSLSEKGSRGAHQPLSPILYLVLNQGLLT